MPPEENEEPQDKSQTSDDTKGEEKSFLDGTYKGQKVTWSQEEARALAQKGYDYEAKMGQLKVDKEAHASDQEDLAKFKAWRSGLQADPARAEAVMRAYQDPNSVLGRQSNDDDDDDGGQRYTPAPAAAPEVFQLRSQIEQLQSSMDQMSSSNDARKATDRLGRAVDSNSLLSSNPEMKDTASEFAKGLMSRDPEMSPEGAIAVAVEQLGGIMRSTNQQKLDRKGKAENMRTGSAEDGSPQGASDKPKEKAKWGRRQRSNIRNTVMEQLKSGLFKERFPNA